MSAEVMGTRWLAEEEPAGGQAAAGGGAESREGEPAEGETRLPEVLPLLPVRDVVIFPYMIIPLFVGREMSIAAVNEALGRNRLILLATQKDVAEEEPSPEQIYRVGTAAAIMRVLKLPDGRVKILVQGMAKARIVEYVQHKPAYLVRIEPVVEPTVSPLPVEVEALMRTVREQVEKIISLGKTFSNDILLLLENVGEPGRLADILAANLGLKVEEAQKVLEIDSPVDRLRRVYDLLVKEIELLSVQQRIQSQVKEEISRSQKEYFLREQLRAIRHELGDLDDKAEEINELREKIKAAGMPPEVEKEALKQLRRLEQMHAEAAEASMVRTYLDWMVELPWSKSSPDEIDIKKAKQILDEDHYDLEKVKDRILEYLAVRKLNPQMKGPILCFVGPPGVGKTSLGKSIARALGRSFVRISLGGVRDEAEIRGHRRTYVGALPGRIIQGMKQAGTNNPVFMLDEVDKLGTDFRGDPSAALLEVLDPQQNHAFSDHYLNVPFDLSKVMFITTANLLDPIPSALKDRMEVLRLAGYTEEEKLRIARQFLIPRQLAENGITAEVLDLSDQALLAIIQYYTREAGLRNLEREIGTICRKVARRIAEGEKGPFRVTAQNLHKYLGAPKFLPEEEHEVDEVGVATGLAWTEVGGDVLRVEATMMKGKGKLTLTGHLGEIMKESAQAALSYARSRADALGIPKDAFDERDFHIHVPAGAIPKDGPSAGITIATALVSLLTGVPVRHDVAMTGEITLRGRVLPVGGLKEKTLAAARAKIGTVIIPERNRKDMEELPAYLRRKVTFVPVKNMDQVLEVALARPPQQVAPPAAEPVPADGAPVGEAPE
ncbi:MAG TPA: endopeptidase La, partial [Thermodesulfobacteriota bacterium]|nr:endopeptidase La [Thermodesulfobacteriota bacterium]